MAQPIPLTPLPASEPVTPASGTLVQAWRDVALHPTRHTFAAWAQAAQQRWITLSLVVGAALTLLTSASDHIRAGLTPTGSAGDMGHYMPPFSERAASVIAILTSPISYVLGVLAVAASLALFMPATYGAWRVRFERALRPWALAQVGLGIAGLTLSLIGLALTAASRTLSGPVPSLTALPVVIALGVLAFFGGIGMVIYYVVMLLQAGTVGSDLGRWAVLGAALLGYIATGIVSAILTGIITAPFFLTPLLLR